MIEKGEHGGSVVECRTREQDVGVGGGGTLLPESIGNTQEGVAPFRHD